MSPKRTRADKMINELCAKYQAALGERSPEDEARLEAQHQRHERAEQERQELRRRRKWAQWGIPSKDIAAIADGRLEATKAVAEIEAFENERAILLVLSGPVGCGKTTAAGRWLIGARDRGTLITPKPRRFLPIAECARLNRFSDEALIPIEHAKALVLDDLGAEYLDDKGALASLLESIIDARYRHVLPTVITTNLRSAAFKERYGERVADRIRECGEFVELQGGSLRPRKRVP